jgi:hypothetical protein
VLQQFPGRGTARLAGACGCAVLPVSSSGPGGEPGAEPGVQPDWIMPCPSTNGVSPSSHPGMDLPASVAVANSGSSESFQAVTSASVAVRDGVLRVCRSVWDSAGHAAVGDGLHPPALRSRN